MFQKFYTETLVGSFIKHLLSVSPLPHLNYVDDGDLIIEGCTYIYKKFIITCTKTGELFVTNAKETLFPGDEIFPSLALLPETGKATAGFKVVRYVEQTPTEQHSYKYLSKRSYYDAETHRYLGEYLRWLRGAKKLNLFPFYNCFTQEYITNVTLRKDSALVTLYPDNNIVPLTSLYPGRVKSTVSTYTTATTSETDYKVMCVPIKFNQVYTIALECNSPVILRSIIISQGKLIKENAYSETTLSDMPAMTNSYKVYSSTRFSKPFLYEVGTDSKLLYSHENNLKLLIQIPSSVNTSVVILEGNYTNLNTFNTNNDAVQTYPEAFNLSLLYGNSLESYAFSDRLIEYLLKNVICELDDITDNVARVQLALQAVDEEFSKIFNENCSLGVWDNFTSNAVNRFIRDKSKTNYLVDMDGNVNKDVEDLLYRFSKGAYDI